MNLYLRLFILLFRLIGLPRKGLFEESRVAFRVLPNDCDINFHMNNGRYLTFMDLGRVHLMTQLRAIPTFIRKRWKPVIAAAEVNFIRSLTPFQKFELVTRLVTWDEKYCYMEQKFESGGAVCAHALVKAAFLSASGRLANSTVVAELGFTESPPPMPEELRLWAELGGIKKQKA